MIKRGVFTILIAFIVFITMNCDDSYPTSSSGWGSRTCYTSKYTIDVDYRWEEISSMRVREGSSSLGDIKYTIDVEYRWGEISSMRVYEC